jgi:hypothetical protein
MSMMVLQGKWGKNFSNNKIQYKKARTDGLPHVNDAGNDINEHKSCKC